MAKKTKTTRNAKHSSLAAQARRNKALQLPSMTLVATSAMAAAREACAAKVDAIVEECLANNSKFRDSKFDILSDRKNCLYASLTSETVYQVAGARRLPDIFRHPVFFLNGVSPDDIKQGATGNCWFVASLAVISNVPGLLEQLCVKRNEQVGVYGFIFFKDGDWVSTVVDDQLFYKINETTRRKTLVFGSCNEERESWLPLIEKAYAKIHGDYEILENGLTSEGIEDLTGGTSSILFTSDILDKDRFWEEEMKMVNKVTLMGCSITHENEDSDKDGIIHSHAYSILDVAEYEGERLVHVRNPWGATEWNGDWSDQSEKWTPDAIKALSHVEKDDGKFWMSYKDFLRIFNTIDRCRVFDVSWSVASNWISYNVEPRSSGEYHFELTEDSETVIVLNQPDTRYYGAFDSKFIHILAFHVYDSDKKLIMRARGTGAYPTRSVNCELKLKAGSYTVIPHVQREPTDVIHNSDSENDTEKDNALTPGATRATSDAIDKGVLMFQQRKATMVRSMSMARVMGRKLLGVDDEDFEDVGLDTELEEAKWQLMLGLRVYSHDPNLKLDGHTGDHPLLKECDEDEQTRDTTEKEDPEGVTATLADKLQISTEPKEE
ncbi:hypothetical protein BG011_000210 [Mortierella polycephala]|uniref:Calpain catalytic domain-containing protein n=1 Tax=Mortierella polycephala TaxID=41804 RepID=A0A9P6TVT3_9FUNG|nr:hypothetical protein BG011_000210 [Mortierella polycephala]